MSAIRVPIALKGLRQIVWFNDLSDEELATIRPLLRERRFLREQTLFHQGDPGGCLYFLLSGRVRIYLSSADGRETTVRIYGPNSAIGELSVLDGLPRSASAAALDDVSAMLLYREDLFGLLREHFELTERLLQSLAERLRYTTSFSEQLAFLSAPGRVASVLLQLASNDPQPTVRLALTQQELANLAGTTREWANRALHSFAAAHLIRLERGAVEVLDREGLRGCVQ